MRSFRNLDVDSSMYYFDMAISASRRGSLAPYLWQPGISCSYLNRYSEGHEQFRLNVSANFCQKIPTNMAFGSDP